MRDGTTGDDLVLARLIAGDDAALAIAYDRDGGFVHALARRVTGDDAAARDITQDVFTLLWRQPDRVDLGRGSLRTYLGIVTHRRAANEVRARAQRHAREQRVAVAQSDGTTADELVEADARHWRASRLRALVDALPAEQRAVLELAYFDGLTHREIATRLHIPEGTAKSRLRLALARLRTILDDQPQEAWR